MSIVHDVIRKLGAADPALRPLMAAVVLEARITQELLRVKYDNLGDFGGHDPVMDSWVLEVAGPTFEIKDTLKKLGLQWQPASKTWRLDATLYKYNTSQRDQAWNRARKLQKAALPVLQQLAKEHNTKAEIENQTLRPEHGTKDFVEMLKRQMRMAPRLEEAGIKVTWKHPGRYDVSEATVYVSGNTFPFAALMKKHGFKWDASKKAWWMIGPDYSVIGDKWMGEIIRELPKKPAAPTVTTTPFSDMTDSELTKFLAPHVEVTMIENEYFDGEVSEAEVMARTKLRLKRLSPADQTKTYEEMKQGPRRYAGKSAKVQGPAMLALSKHWNQLHDLEYDLSKAIGEYDAAASYSGGPGEHAAKGMIKVIEATRQALRDVADSGGVLDKLQEAEAQFVKQFGTPGDYAAKRSRAMFKH